MIVETARRLETQGSRPRPGACSQPWTITDIARELRTSPADIYRFFGSKAELDKAVREYKPEEPPENPEPTTPPDSGPPLKPGSVGQALPLPEQDRFVSLWPAKVA